MHSWPHAPARRAHEGGAFILTAGTCGKRPFFQGEERMNLLQCNLFALAEERGLGLEAWALFPNHYHLVGRGENGPFDITEFARHLHGRTSVALNRLDGTAGRQVWQNFRDTALTSEHAYFARLHYVHTNPVKHGVMAVARDYPYCSAHWFETQAEEAFVRTVYSFKIDRVQVEDDY